MENNKFKNPVVTIEMVDGGIMKLSCIRTSHLIR